MPNSKFAMPRENRYFEDYVVGSIHEFGPIAVTEEEVISFARRYDPQPFHIDPTAAKNPHFGGLIASGWLTAGLMMRLLVDNVVSGVASLGSPGVNELRWLKPVRPGDVLRIRVTVLEATPSRSRSDRGMVRSLVEVLNQDGEVVMSMKPMNIIRRRGQP